MQRAEYIDGSGVEVADDSFKPVDFQLIGMSVFIDKGVIAFSDLLLDLLKTDLIDNLLLITCQGGFQFGFLFLKLVLFFHFYQVAQIALNALDHFDQLIFVLL